MDSYQKSPNESAQDIEGGSTQVPNWQIITAFVFGALFLTAILVLVVLIPNPTPAQFLVFRIVISLAAAGIVGIFSGYLHVQGQVAQWTVRGGGALAVFLVVYFFSPTLVNASAVNQECTGDNCEQYVTVHYNYGITQEDHEKALKQREQEVIERLSKTDPSDRLIREVLENELNVVTAKLKDLDESYQDELASRAEAEKALKEIKEKLPESQAEAALGKFKAGDKDAAKTLFDNVIEQAEKHNDLAAKAAYHNGLLAKEDVRFREAIDYLLKAIQFNSNKAEYHYELGATYEYLYQYGKALEHFKAAHTTYPASDSGVAKVLRALGRTHFYLAFDKRNSDYANLDDDVEVATYGGQRISFKKSKYFYSGFLLQYYYVFDQEYNGSHFSKSYIDHLRTSINYFEAALSRDVLRLGDDNIIVFEDRNYLAIVNLHLGNTKEAIEYFRIILDGKYLNDEENSEMKAITMNNIGAAFLAGGQVDRASAAFIDAGKFMVENEVKNAGLMIELLENVSIARREKSLSEG